MTYGGTLFLFLLIALIVALPIWTIGPTMIIGLLLVLVLVLILIGTI